MEWKEFERRIKDVLINYGACSEKYRIKITYRELFNYASDWAWIYVDIYEPRKKKPFIFWKLKYNVPREVVYMSESEFNYYRKPSWML